MGKKYIKVKSHLQPSKLKLFLFCVPAIVLYLLFWIVPSMSNIFLSLTEWRGTTSIFDAEFIGLKNYAQLGKDPLFWNALGNNFTYAAITVVFTVIIALFLAVVIERVIKRGKPVFRAVLFMPMIMPWVVVSMLWTWLYDPSIGLLNVALESIGLGSFTQLWLGDPNIALYSVSAVGIWKSFGFHMIIIIAGLQGIPKSLEEQSYIDGATPFQSFIHITLPLLRPILGIVITLTLIDAFRAFDAVFIMTQGGPGHYSTDILSTYIYRLGFSYLEHGYGAAISITLFILIASLSLISFRISSREAYE